MIDVSREFFGVTCFTSYPPPSGGGDEKGLPLQLSGNSTVNWHSKSQWYPDCVLQVPFLSFCTQHKISIFVLSHLVTGHHVHDP